MSLRVKEYIQLKYILYFYFNLFLKLPATMSPFAKQFERSNGISIVLRQDIERTSFAEKVPQDLQARQKIEQFFRYEVLNNQNSLLSTMEGLWNLLGESCPGIFARSDIIFRERKFSHGLSEMMQIIRVTK